MQGNDAYPIYRSKDDGTQIFIIILLFIVLYLLIFYNVFHNSNNLLNLFVKKYIFSIISRNNKKKNF